MPSNGYSMATIVPMLLLAMPLCITSQSGFGRPWSSVSALDDFFDDFYVRYGSDRHGSGRHGLASGFYSSGYDDEYDDHYDDYFGQRPQAKPQAGPTQGDGERYADGSCHLDVNVPQHSTHTANLDAVRHSTHSARLAQPAPQAPHQRPMAPSAATANTAAMSRDSSRSNNVIPAPHEHAPVETPVPRAALPSSDGIEVEDADFPWPEKNADASEGWFDNRGDFQYYGALSV